ncbi:MAG: cytochrome b N-terminal domain-containing protein [Desulfopila sp.]
MNRITSTSYRTLTRFRWGSWTLVSLYLSVASGIVVALQYDLANPYYSVVGLDLLVPYGAFFRSVHFYSSQAFFLLGCIHLLAAYAKTEDYSRQDWQMLVLSLVAGLLLLFTGYILRADSTGFAAGMIAESIIKTIPLAGDTLNAMFFAISDQGLHRVYVHHVITLDALWLVLVWGHLRRYRVRLSEHLPFICLLLMFSLAVSAPLDQEQPGTTYIAGPWFYLGLQEMLRYFPPLFAGVIWPASFVAALLYAKQCPSRRPLLLRLIFLWLLLYATLSVIAWLR